MHRGGHITDAYHFLVKEWTIILPSDKYATSSSTAPNGDLVLQLRIKNFQKADAGKYNMLVKNLFGEVNNSATVELYVRICS